MYCLPPYIGKAWYNKLIHKADIFLRHVLFMKSWEISTRVSLNQNSDIRT